MSISDDVIVIKSDDDIPKSPIYVASDKDSGNTEFDYNCNSVQIKSETF